MYVFILPFLTFLFLNRKRAKRLSTPKTLITTPSKEVYYRISEPFYILIVYAQMCEHTVKKAKVLTDGAQGTHLPCLRVVA